MIHGPHRWGVDHRSVEGRKGANWTPELFVSSEAVQIGVQRG